MKNWHTFLYSLPTYLLSTIASVLTIAQAALAFFLRGAALAHHRMCRVGSACGSRQSLASCPSSPSARKAASPKGQSYMKTTKLVDTGIYAIVRHPQGGTAWLLINLALMLVAWHWTSVILGLVSMGLAYADTFKADQTCIQKFGEAYQRYMHKVPRVNFVAGIFRLVRRRSQESRGE